MITVVSPMAEPATKTTSAAYGANGSRTKGNEKRNNAYEVLCSQYAERQEEERTGTQPAATLWARLQAITQITLTIARNPTKNSKYDLEGNIQTCALVSMAVFSCSKRTSAASATPPRKPSMDIESEKYFLVLSMSCCVGGLLRNAFLLSHQSHLIAAEGENLTRISLMLSSPPATDITQGLDFARTTEDFTEPNLGTLISNVLV
jgi:hypothetical protein